MPTSSVQNPPRKLSAAGVTTNVSAPGNADFLVIERAGVRQLAGKRVHRLILDESHDIKYAHGTHGIASTYKWAVTATPKKVSGNIIESLKRQLPALGLEALSLVGANKVPGGLDAWMRAAMVTVGQDAIAHMLPQTVETVIDVASTPYEIEARRRFDLFVAAHPRVHNPWAIVSWERQQGSFSTRDLHETPLDVNHLHAMPNVADMPKIYDVLDDCPICLEVTDPCVETACKHRFCNECLFMGTKNSLRCPMCRRNLDFKKLKLVLDSAGPSRAPEPEPQAEGDGESDIYVFSSKIVKAAELVQQNVRKSIVFVSGHNCAMYTKDVFSRMNVGSIIMASKRATPALKWQLTRFVNDDAVRAIVLDMTKLSSGLNLTVADQVIFINRPTSDAIKTQAIGRICRLGQTSQQVRVFTLKNVCDI